jgi:hypothetical protein
VDDLEPRGAERRLLGGPPEPRRGVRGAVDPDDDLAGHTPILADPRGPAETQRSSHTGDVPMQSERQ